MAGIKHIDVGANLTKIEWEAANTHEITSGTSFPESPSEKDLFYRTDEHKWYIYTDSAWDWINRSSLDDIDDVDASSPSTGDILVYNETTSKWVTNAEAFNIAQINLTPQPSPPSDTEGGIYYDSGDDHLYVARGV